MPGELSLLRPYNYSEVRQSGHINYRFTTDRHISYLVYFTDAGAYFPEHPEFNQEIVTFGFGPVTPIFKGYFVSESGESLIINRIDTRVKDTLFQILLDTIAAYPQKAIFIMCDTMDGKHPCRNNLFNKWFSEFEKKFPGRAFKYNNEIVSPTNDPNDCAKLLLLIPGTCVLHDKIVNAFMSLDDELESKGF
jgi:hypothetical protein